MLQTFHKRFDRISFEWRFVSRSSIVCLSELFRLYSVSRCCLSGFYTSVVYRLFYLALNGFFAYVKIRIYIRKRVDRPSMVKSDFVSEYTPRLCARGHQIDFEFMSWVVWLQWICFRSFFNLIWTNGGSSISVRGHFPHSCSRVSTPLCSIRVCYCLINILCQLRTFVNFLSPYSWYISFHHHLLYKELQNLFTMAPSATSDLVAESKVGAKVESSQPEKHVHGAENKTPLEAISHGPLIHSGASSS